MPSPTLLSLPDLPAALQTLIAQIPSGCVTTFGDLAAALGDVAAARWVAQWLRDEWTQHPQTEHARVVLRTGDLPRWSDELHAWQTQQLHLAGIPFLMPGRTDPAARWNEFVTDYPLRRLSEWQAVTVRQAVWSTPLDVPQIIGGVDLSYASPKSAVAAYVAVEVATGAIVFEHTITAPVPFPYIPGYLTFRELPPLLALLDDVRQLTALAPVILVDGTGRLHPRQAGLAVAVGLCGGCTTVGVSKHQLCGQIRPEETIDGCPTIWQQADCLGAVLTTGSKRRTVFISPGTGIDLASSLRIVRSVWHTERLPKPIARADALSRQIARRSG